MAASKSLLWFVPIVLVGLVVWFAVPADDAEKQVAKEGVPPKETEGGQEGPAAKPTLRAGCFFDTDYAASYIIKNQTKATFTQATVGAATEASDSGTTQKLDAAVRLHLHLRHLQTESNQSVLEAKLGAAESPEPSVQKLWAAEEVESVFFIKLSTQCEFLAFAFQPGVQPKTRARISALMQMLEVHFLSGAAKARWSVTQNDKNGQALVQYRRMQQSDFHFGRKRLTYIKHWQCTSKHYTRAGIRASRGIFEADKYGQWIKNLESTEIINFFVAKQVVAKKEISIELTQTESTADTWKTSKTNPATLKWHATGTQPPEYVSDLLVE